MKPLFKYPIKLEFEAHEREDGQWEAKYTEYFNPEDTEAFAIIAEIAEKSKNFPYPVAVNKEKCFFSIKIIGARGTVFSALCGEFFILQCHLRYGRKN